MNIKHQIKTIVPEKLLWFFRRTNYISLLFYSWNFGKKSLFTLYYKPFYFPLKQTVKTISLNDFPLISDSEDVLDHFRKSGFRILEGRHCLYLPPKNNLNNLLDSNYPHSVDQIGIKIVKSQQFARDKTPYYTSSKLAPASSSISMRAVGSVLEKVTVSNLLNLSDCAPRVYDLVRFSIAGSTFFGLIVQHIDGEPIIGSRGEEFIKKFKEILRQEKIEIVALKNNKDFQSPGYNSNILIDTSGSCKYIDIQNFCLLGKRDLHYPAGLLKRFCDTDSFDANGTIQSKAISRFEAQQLHRSILRFSERLVQRLKKDGFEFNEKKIFDCGYPFGLLTGIALSAGAAWSYLPESDDGRIGERFLLENGFSRFEIFSISDGEEKEEECEIDLLVLDWRYDMKTVMRLNKYFLIQYVLLDCHDFDKDDGLIETIEQKLEQIGFSCLEPSSCKSEPDIKFYRRC